MLGPVFHNYRISSVVKQCFFPLSEQSKIVIAPTAKQLKEKFTFYQAIAEYNVLSIFLAKSSTFWFKFISIFTHLAEHKKIKIMRNNAYDLDPKLQEC